MDNSKAKLNRWAQQLLDIGKRNRLINFKDLKIGTVEIVAPDVETIFEKASGTSTLEVFDPKLIDEFADMEESLNNVELSSMSKKEYINTYSNRMNKSNQILLYNIAQNPIASLKNIDKKAKSAIEETGVNIAYFAFGFIHWKENENSDIMYNAPVLLSPVILHRESLVTPYKIEFADEDIVLNPTFSYFLEANYGIKLPEYKEGTLTEYLSSVEEKISKLGWKISSECKLSTFSFLKINMYYDLKNNEEEILENDVIKQLLGEQVSDFNNISDEERRHFKNGVLNLHTVVDADSSQIEAIELAKAGKSFVLQGPPGTGKSQTITNIIAECLYDGKKVLFVSEKQAALNVVYGKLKESGLSEFCLELHSHKANKKAVIDELNHTLNLAKSCVSQKADAEIEMKAEAQKKLDAYVEELHEPREIINKSLFQIFEAYSELRKAPELRYNNRLIEERGEEYLKTASNHLTEYVDYIQTIGYDYKKNSWYGYNRQDTSFQANQETYDNMAIVKDCYDKLYSVSKELKNYFGIEAHNVPMIAKYSRLLGILGSTKTIVPETLNEKNIYQLKISATDLNEICKKALELKEKLENAYEPNFFENDGKELHKKLVAIYGSSITRLFNAEYKILIGNLSMQRKEAVKMKYSEALKDIQELEEYQTLTAEFNKEVLHIDNIIGDIYNGMITDWETVVSEAEVIIDTKVNLNELNTIHSFSKEAFSAAQCKMRSCFEDIEQNIEKSKEAITYLSKFFDIDSFDFVNESISHVLEKVSHCIEDFGKINNWNNFRSLLDKLRNLKLDDYISIAIDGNIGEDSIVPAFKKNFYRQWAEIIINKVPILADFTRITQDIAVKTFAEKDKLQLEISKAQIKAMLSAGRPTMDFIAQGSEISVLRREGEKKRKQKPIRQLFNEIGGLVQILKPCFLMSPLSVSTFLDTDSIHFDVIVFDEASQIFPQDAIGAIYRGQSLIVVGDSKQMPPSNFFNASTDIEDDDEETGDITDFESILDICSATMPQRRLSWHYRSRYEQLIAFSNRYFYDNSLITFPSVKTDDKGTGVDYYHVDGIFDHKSKTNRAEAEFVVDLILENIKKFPDRSLGVVAFSISQQDLIDSLLAKRRKEDSSYEWFFSSDVQEPFFVKNLETVQGDERDTIIFSIAYGKDTQGRLLHNFGPLNKSGGERRLNVAISRAKSNTQVVTSMHHYDIDLSRTGAEGAKLLKAYLDYAENGAVALDRSVEINQFDTFDSEFEMEVCDFLRENGFSVDSQVGCSGYKIDLGLRKPQSSDYVLAIECDGASYHSSKNARDRDRLRQAVLENMGWTFYRIWSTDWFKNKKIEQSRLLDACKKALGENQNNNDKGSNQKKDECIDKKMSFTVEQQTMHHTFPKYKKSNRPISKYSFQIDLREILQDEAPLSEEWLLKRITYLFDREKVTSAVRTEYEQLMYGCLRNGIIRKNGFLYLDGNYKYILRVPGEKRDIQDIAIEELAAGMCIIIRENIAVDKNGLFSAIVNQLGYFKRSELMNDRLEKALSFIGHMISVDNEMISLKQIES